MNPTVAVVGLSPGGTQLNKFIEAYNEDGDYTTASIEGAFADLEINIINMLRGLGVAKKLNLQFPRGETLARHPDIYVTSLVGCATLDSKSTSDDFDPMSFPGARKCISQRLLNDLLSVRFTRLRYVIVFGEPGKAAVKNIEVEPRHTLEDVLHRNGKVVLYLPHPGNQNIECINLASLQEKDVPPIEQYVEERWQEYKLKPLRKGRKQKQPESTYKKKRELMWNAVQDARRQVDELVVLP